MRKRVGSRVTYIRLDPRYHLGLARYSMFTFDRESLSPETLFGTDEETDIARVPVLTFDEGDYVLDLERFLKAIDILKDIDDLEIRG